MSSSTSRWIVGIAVVLVLSTAAVGVLMPTTLGLLFGGLIFSLGGAGIGGLGAEEMKGDGECITGGGGAVTASQSEYVRSIVGVGKDLGVSKQGQIVAVMVALAESGIQNYANNGKNHFNFNIGTPQGTQFWLDAVKKHSMNLPHDEVGMDADSVGLFQQRPSAGWANSGGFKAADDPETAINRLMNPEFSARAFYGGPGGVPNPGLLDVEGWEDMEPTVAAQTVQGSNFPSAYAKWEDQATKLVEAESDAPAISEGESSSGGSGSSGDDDSGSDAAEASAGSDEDEPEGSSGSSELSMPMKEGTTITSEFGGRDSPGGVGSSDHKGLDFGDDIGSPINAAADGEVVAAGSATGFGQWVVIDHKIDGKKWSTVYGHVTPDGIKVKKGDKVKAGDQIAELGNEGTSTGPHLHFETWDGGRFSGGKAVDPQKAVSGEHQATGGDAADASGGNCSVEDASSGGGGAEATGDVKDIIKKGEEQEGVDYSWGGGTKDGPSEGFAQGAGVTGFDCSSLMQYMIYQATKYELPRTAAEQYEHTKGNQVAKAGDGVDDLKPGDLLFWGDSASTIDHVAMYVGDGKMIEAPRTGLKVRTTEARVEGDSRFFGATRINYSEKKA